MQMLEQMLVLFIIMIIGYIAYKRNIITDEVSKKLSGIVVNIANPALILSGVIGDTQNIYGKDLLVTMAVAVGMFVVLMGIGYFMPKVLRTDQKSAGIYKVMTVFSNIGFMGFPIIAAVLGNSALLYATIFLLPYNFLIYTYGIRCIKGNQKKEKVSIAKVLNIGVIFCIIAIVIFAFKIELPEFMNKTIGMLSNLAAPLSMMVIGASFAVMELKSLFTDVRLLVFSVIKLLLIPIVGVFILKSFLKNEMLLAVCMFMLCTPVGSMTAMLAQEYEGDYYLTAKGVALTTALSVITMPIVSGVLRII